MEIFGVPLQAMMSQLLLGLVNGSFYAMLSLGLAVIFGLLNVINFSHGALYMMGAFAAFRSVYGLATWFVIEKTRLGAYLRAGTENPKLVEAFGVNVPLLRPAGPFGKELR